jgi:hypothetical protein
MQPMPAPDPIVPAISAALEGEIDRALDARLGRPATAEERSDYRRALWALATAVRSILSTSSSLPPPSCPAPLSTSEKAANPTTSSA